MSDGYPSDWNSRRKKVYKRDNYTCQNCGRQGGPHGNAELHAHHKVPKSKGGSHDLNNLKTLCTYCHDAVHSGGIVSPKLSLGSWKRHLFYFIFTLGIGNIIHLFNSLWKSYREKRAVNKRLRRAKYGSLKMHVLLFLTTAGIGNIIYYYIKHPNRSIF